MSVSHLHVDRQHVSSVGFGIIESGELLAIRQTFHSLSVFASVLSVKYTSPHRTDGQKKAAATQNHNLKIYLWTMTDPKVIKSIQFNMINV